MCVRHNVGQPRSDKGKEEADEDDFDDDDLPGGSPVQPRPPVITKKPRKLRTPPSVDVATFLALQRSGSCTCALLRKHLVAPTRALALAVDVAIRQPANKGSGLLSRRELLLALCPSCSTLDDVDAAGGQDNEGVVARFWAPAIDLSSLSVLDAYHLALSSYAKTLPDGAAYELNRFRAHTMAHSVTNYTFYVVKGRANKIGGTPSPPRALFFYYSPLSSRSGSQSGGTSEFMSSFYGKPTSSFL